MDFEAELAAFAEIEQLAEQVPVETNHATPAAAAVREPAAAANGPAVPPAAGAASALPQGAAAASADALSGKKRKLPTADRDGAAKKAHTAAPSFIVSSGATTAAPAAAVPAEDSGAFSSVVEADLIALQQRQAATAAATAADASAAAASHSAAAADSVAAASASTGAAASQQQGGYITGRVYNGWLASLHPTTGEPMWVEATPEQIEAAAANEIIEAQQAAAEAAAAKKAAKKAAKLAAKQGIGGIPLASGGIASGAKAGASQEKHHLRTAAGQVWDDPTLQDWPENDHRLFCGDLGNEVSEQLLTKVFERYPSFARAKVIRDKRTGKSKGFGFVSFTVLGDMISALKEQDGKYVGNRPIRLKKSEWDKRDASADKTWTAKHNQFGNQVTAGNRKLHLY